MSRLIREIDRQTLLVIGYHLIPQHVTQHTQEIVSLTLLGTLLVTTAGLVFLHIHVPEYHRMPVTLWVTTLETS